MEVDATAQPFAQPLDQPAQTHAHAPPRGETHARAPRWEVPTGPGPKVYGSKDKEGQ